MTLRQMIPLTSRFLLISLFMTAYACTPAFQGEYRDPTERQIIDDRWNEADAHKSSEVLINAMLKKNWLKDFKRSHNNAKPVVIVSDIENRTDEHLDTKALGEFMRDELINAGTIRFVNKAKRQAILDEIKYQQSGAVNKQTAKSTGKQIGADFLLSGSISSQVHQMEDIKTVTYQVNVTLTNLETAEYVFSQKHHIKKQFKRSGAGW